MLQNGEIEQASQTEVDEVFDDKVQRHDPFRRLLKVSEVTSHHRELGNLFEAAHAGCHLCQLISTRVRGPSAVSEDEMMEFLSKTQVELSFNSWFAGKEGFGRNRLYFADTDPNLKRTPDNYYNFMRLQIWPAEEFGYLFEKPAMERLSPSAWIKARADDSSQNSSCRDEDNNSHSDKSEPHEHHRVRSSSDADVSVEGTDSRASSGDFPDDQIRANDLTYDSTDSSSLFS